MLIHRTSVALRFQDFENQEFNDLDTAVIAFNEIILDVARSSTKYVKNISNTKGKSKNINHGLASHAKT